MALTGWLLFVRHSAQSREETADKQSDDSSDACGGASPGTHIYTMLVPQRSFQDCLAKCDS